MIIQLVCQRVCVAKSSKVCAISQYFKSTFTLHSPSCDTLPSTLNYCLLHVEGNTTFFLVANKPCSEHVHAYWIRFSTNDSTIVLLPNTHMHTDNHRAIVIGASAIAAGLLFILLGLIIILLTVFIMRRRKLKRRNRGKAYVCCSSIYNGLAGEVQHGVWS